MTHPAFSLLLKSIQKSVSIDEKAFLEAHSGVPHTAIKINPNKIKDKTKLSFEIDDANKVMWAKDAYYLSHRPTFYSDPLFYAGAYYVMDSSSMFLEYLLETLNINKQGIVLDIAAAPGGKSVIISNYLNENGLLLSNEINFNRAKILHYNLSKWGKSNFIVSNNATDKFKEINNFFDLVICDAPCTGSGLFRKYPEWIHSFNEQLIEQCVTRQKQILSNLFSSIQENGYLIYSTCSFTTEENEDIAEFILQNGFELVNIPVPENTGIIKTERGIRFFPHLTPSEGFFYSVFQKKVNTNHHSTSFLSKQKSISKSSLDKTPFKEYIAIKDSHTIIQWQKKFYLASKKSELVLSFPLKFIGIGTTISEPPHYMPAAELALSIHLNSQLSKINLSLTEAQQFLKKENLKLDLPKGIYLVQYQECGLGWAKVLENRINNYFPTEWRILKDIE